VTLAPAAARSIVHQSTCLQPAISYHQSHRRQGNTTLAEMGWDVAREASVVKFLYTV